MFAFSNENLFAWMGLNDCIKFELGGRRYVLKVRGVTPKYDTHFLVLKPDLKYVCS